MKDKKKGPDMPMPGKGKGGRKKGC